MRTYDKILLTLALITFWLPFIFQKSEIRLKGTESEYISQMPNMALMIIPYGLISIWLITVVWRQKKIN